MQFLTIPLSAEVRGERQRPAVDALQLALPLEDGQVTPNGRIRHTQDRHQVRHAHLTALVEELQDAYTPFRGPQVFSLAHPKPSYIRTIWASITTETVINTTIIS
jgi:hypothetical protein